MRRTNDVAVCPASSASTRMSPRRIEPGADHVGVADGHDDGVVGDALRRVRPRSGRCGSRRPAPTPPRTARPTSLTFAHSHHSGPVNGWRSTIRRQATTSPDGSKRNDPSAWAVSSTSDVGSAPCARATYRRCSIGCTLTDRSPPADRRRLLLPAIPRSTVTSRYDRSPWPTRLPTRLPAPGAPSRRRSARSSRPISSSRRWSTTVSDRAARHGVAHHLPPRVRRARPVHERELLDPAGRHPCARAVPRLGRPHQSDRHRRRGRRPHLPRAARRAVPGVLRPRSRRRQGHGPRTNCRHSCSHGSTVSSPRPPRAGTRTSGKRSPTPSPRSTWWTSIPVPGPGDPGPFRGSPALG